ncbi:MAG: sulfotransferase [Anaerolineales bacterium]
MPFSVSKLFRKPEGTKVIIIVSGLPRSGTSMMMKMLESAGLEILTDNLRTADANNPKGYYEFERVKKLKAGDFDWLSTAQGKVVKVISALLEYLPNQYQYKIIFMRRNMDEILSSQRQMLVRDGKHDDEVPDGKLAELYENHLKKIGTWLEQQPNMSTLYISYNQIVRDPEPDLNRIIQFLGKDLDIKSMLQVVDRDLYRERRSG